MRRTPSKTHHARQKSRKSPAQLDREITAALTPGRKKRSATTTATAAKKHELFYLSEEQQGGKHAEHIERFDNLPAALDMLARLPEGSITYGNAAEGPKFMLVWAAPTHTEMLYWTDGDLNVLDATREEARAIRKRQTKRYGDLDERFRKAVKR